MEWASIYVSTSMAGCYTRSKPPGHIPSSLYLSHDGITYSRKEGRLDSHTKCSVSGILIRPDFLPCDPNIGTSSQDPGDHSIHPESMGGGQVRVWQILLGLFVATKKFDRILTLILKQG